MSTMNPAANVMPEIPMGKPTAEYAAIPEARLLYWALRRELWENRSIYLAPLGAGAVVIFGFFVSRLHWSYYSLSTQGNDASKQGEMFTDPYNFAALVIMAISFIVALFYSTEAMHGERRDRSILFWKSLPVSDRTTVLAKAMIPILIIPCIAFGVTLMTQSMMLLLGSAALLASGQSAAVLWDHMPLFPMWLMLFYHLIVIHGLWNAPIYGWLLLVSAWAKRVPFLWAVLPMVAIGGVEKIAFNSSNFLHLLGDRLAGGPEGAAFNPNAGMDGLMQIHPVHFLLSPGMCLGFAAAAAFLAGAVRLRKYREAI